MINHSIPVVPEGYNTINSWLIPKGAAGLIDFLKTVFDAQEEEAARIPDVDGLLLHAEVKIGNSIIMVFDSKPDWPPTPGFLQVYVENAEALLQRAQKAGAEIVTELSEFVYGEKLARFRDPWGNLWWINQRIEQVDNQTEADKVQGELDEYRQSQASEYIYDTLMQAMQQNERRAI